MSQSIETWRNTILSDNVTIAQAIINLNDVSAKIVLIVNHEGIFQGTVSDGDIRRGLLRGLTLNSPITGIIHRNALVAPPELSREMVIQLMVANKIQQIPVLDKSRRVIGLHIWPEIVKTSPRENLMVIMAGGMGRRLLPITENCPKPLVRVAGKPMLEHIIERAKLQGFINFVIAIHHLGHMIEEYFGSGERLGVRINYLRESSPLGTAGALSLLNPIPSLPFVITNGDVITDIHYGELIDFHARLNAVATMAVRLYEWHHPFGVVEIQGIKITGFEEKPIIRSHINAGIYVLSPSALKNLDMGEKFDMPDIFKLLQSKGEDTVAYPMHEPWLDVGRPDDFKAANNI
jgi:dTDP-glucose pyrophosphorylase